MSVDLEDLIPALEAEMSPPGNDLYATVTDAEWVTRLANGFWEGRLHGLFEGYQEFDGIINPISGTEDLSRELQQMIILYTAFQTTLSTMNELNTVFRAKAGSVEYETQKSATTLKGVLDAIRERMKLALNHLTSVGSSTVYAFDTYVQRDYNLVMGEAYWVQ